MEQEGRGASDLAQIDEPCAGQRSQVRTNAIANYVGRGWATIIALICLPLFVGTLGKEAYGLIGMFAVLQTWTLLFDFGLTPTLNREIVRARAGTRTWQSLANLVRSTEVVVFLLVAIIVIVVVATAPAVAAGWLKPRQLPTQTVLDAIILMGILAGTRWIEQVYRGAIQGSEDQVWLNLLLAGTETARWLGALAVVVYVAADVLAFFGWNLIVSIISASVLRRRVMRLLKRQGITGARLSIAELAGVRAFAGGMFLSSILTFSLTQADKLVVSAVVSLSDFGVYALVGTAAAGLLQLVQPMNAAVLPRFTALVEGKRELELTRAFHLAAEWLSAIVLPIGLVIVIFPDLTLLAWTGQPSIALKGAPILSLMMLASLVNAVANIPYMLQLAHGWTSLTNKVNAVAFVIMLPALVWATQRYGGVGAAATLAGLNFLSLIVMSQLVVVRLLTDGAARWLGFAIVAPTAVGLAAALGLRMILPAAESRLEAFLGLVASGTVVGCAVLASLRDPRERVKFLAMKRVTRSL